MIQKRESRLSEWITHAPYCFIASVEIVRSIIGIPAIGSDPRRTWIRVGEAWDNEHPCLDATLQRRIPSAKVLMYDHLEPEERRLEMNVTFAQNRESHRDVAEKFASAVAAVADYGVERWADRLLKVLLQDRKVRAV